MEPDYDKLVSNKIRHAEQRPVSWNKQTVWQNVQSETNATRSYHYFYYAAAAVILVLVYFGVQLMPDEVKPQVNDAKIMSAQESIELEKKSIVPEESQNNLPEQTDQNLKIDATVPRKSFRKTVSSTHQQLKPVDAVIEPLVAQIEIQEEEFLVPENVTIRKKKIRPIVGVIIESYSEDVANVKRKKPLRRLESAVPVPWDNVPNALVFARKK